MNEELKNILFMFLIILLFFVIIIVVLKVESFLNPEIEFTIFKKECRNVAVSLDEFGIEIIKQEGSNITGLSFQKEECNEVEVSFLTYTCNGGKCQMNSEDLIVRWIEVNCECDSQLENGECFKYKCEDNQFISVG